MSDIELAEQLYCDTGRKQYLFDSGKPDQVASILQMCHDFLGKFAEIPRNNPAPNRILGNLGFTNLGERHHKYDDLPGFDTQTLWKLTGK